MVGTGVGDALGAPFEGWPWVAPERVAVVADTRQILTYTDDTHMMIGVAESLLRADGFDGEDMAAIFIRNYRLEPFRGYGPGPPYVFRLITGGKAWDKASCQLYSGGSYGNGAAMRVAPIGVLYHDDPEKLRQVVYGSSQITHAHHLGKQGALLQASAVALVTPWHRRLYLTVMNSSPGWPVMCLLRYTSESSTISAGCWPHRLMTTG